MMNNPIESLENKKEELQQQVWELQRQAQYKEGYIHDLLASQQKLIAAIKTTCEKEVEYGTDEDFLALAILSIIDNPPSSVAEEREKRWAVFKK